MSALLDGRADKAKGRSDGDGFGGLAIGVSAEEIGGDAAAGALRVNPGSPSTGSSVVPFFFSADTILYEEDTAFEDVELRPLTPDATVRMRLRAESPATPEPHRGYVIALLDAEDAVPEINEANNVVVSTAIR